MQEWRTPIVSQKVHAVIIADIVDSRKIESFRLKRDRKIDEVSKLHIKQELILSPYAVTAWDEFQVILSKPEYTPRVILDLRRLFYPLELWIAVGIGAATGTHRTPVNLYAGGEAFERAREAANRLKTGSSKYRILTRFESGKEIFDTIANTIYRLQDSLLEGTTAKQWTAINMRLGTGSQDITAKRLKLDTSTVSRNLKRGSYWHLVETVDAMGSIMKSYF